MRKSQPESHSNQYNLIMRLLFPVLFLGITNLTIYSQPFVEQTEISLPGVYLGSVAWGDYDQDGYMDILISGESAEGSMTRIYRNNGDSTFTWQEGISLPGVYHCDTDWGDYDNDGYPDILLTGYSSSGPISRVYRNNGDNTFTEQTSIQLTGIYQGTCKWMDYDNDGDVDIFLIGSDAGYHRIAKIYKNNGNNTFTEQAEIILPGIIYGASIVADFNNDGKTDIALTGLSDEGYITKLFCNTGNNNFTEITENEPFMTYYNASGAWGDYNNDGFIDLFLTGNNDFNRKTFLYQNNGDNSFTEMPLESTEGFVNGSVSLGDYDNDGYIDILISGLTRTVPETKMYRNNGDGSFTEQAEIILTGVWNSCVAWGDYDNDGDMDIIVTGLDAGDNYIAKIYRNDLITKNTAPSEPTGLFTDIDEGIVRFKWDKSFDAQTGQEGLNYNIYVYESGQSYFVRSPHSFPQGHIQNGKRLLPAFGNIQWVEEGYPLMNVVPGKTYYWSVQSIDGGFMGSQFAGEQSFSLPVYRPLNQANGIDFYSIGANQVSITWAMGGGLKRAVFIKEGAEGRADPEDNVSYPLNTNTSNGWRCVYNGTGNSATITGLIPGESYIFHVCEYNGSEGSELYLKEAAFGNPAIIYTVFTEETDISLKGLSHSSVAWGDYDNDGHLDILLTGMLQNYNYFSGIYRNNGDNTFTEQTELSLTQVSESSVAWGDYDNDGYLDILLSGYTSGGHVTIIYRNNRDNTFTEQTAIPLTGVSQGSVVWVDFDNDGDVDVHLTGYSSDGYVSEIYRNEGNHTFTKQAGISLPGITNCSVAWGDYDNDGYLDIIMAGATGTYTNYAPVTKIFRNNGDNTFSEQKGIQLPGVFYCSVAWGDYNSDGYLDVLLTGTTISDRISRIYRNNGDNTFTELTSLSLQGISGGSAVWGDYDNDGDLDILLCGNSNGNIISVIIRNEGGDTFTVQPGILLHGVDYCSVSFADYDNDGDLDILLTGQDPDGNKVSKVYRNNIEVTNQLPAKPENLSYKIFDKNALLSWNKVETDETTPGSISYNLQAGTSSGTINIVSPHASPEGFRRIPALGNAQLDTTFILKDLRWDTVYYAKVQAIDNSFAGGPFSDEVQFNISPVQPSGLHGEYINNTSIMLRWQRGNGDRCVVFAREGTSGMALPQDNITYYANPHFGDGSPIGSSDWYCVYKGYADSLLLTGLESQKNYVIHVIEFQGVNSHEIYAQTYSADNIGVFSTALFSEQTGISLADVSWGGAIWGDYDNDGYLDILVTGNSSSGGKAGIYRNNGDGTFIEQTGIEIPGLNYSVAAWGDYDCDNYLDFIQTGSDIFGNYYTKIFHNNGNNIFTEQTGITLNNDGYPDILLTGMDKFQVPVSKVYRNNGNSTFTEQVHNELTGIWAGIGEWIDYDNDGYPDIILNGQPASGVARRTEIYRNNGDNTFIMLTDIPEGMYWARSISWGDYNNDGKPDALVTGWGFNGIYRYNENGEFVAQSGVIDLPSFSGDSYSTWGDYDNDGYLDIFIAGQTVAGYQTMIFRNNGNNSFSEQQEVILPGIIQGSLRFGDYDNDGDIDILMTGSNKSGLNITKLFRNNLLMKAGIYSPNKKPAAPMNLRSTDVPGGTRLSWDPVTGDETPDKTLSYNLRFRRESDEFWKFASLADDNGNRRIPAIGNIHLSNSYTLKNLESDKYYWQVQAIDHGYLGSAWSALDSFVVKNTQAFFQADNVCQGLPTNFNDQSVAGDGIASWHWDFSDGSFSDAQHPEHIFAGAGSSPREIRIFWISSVRTANCTSPSESADFIRLLCESGNAVSP